MSVASHEKMAEREDLAAIEHEAKYDPDAAQRRERCRSSRSASAESDPCWTSVTNPTAEHLKHAEEYRARAADHRAASQSLRAAEENACREIARADRDESPFDRREDIERTEVLTEEMPSGKIATRRTVGVVVYFHAVPGLTATWLQREMDCHLARNAALGHDVPEMRSCPLVLKNVRTTVREARGGFAVEVRSDDEATAKEIVRRTTQTR